jgi:hypothetical protein
VSVSAIAEPASAPKGAAPPLAHQIAHAASVVFCTTSIAAGAVSYRVDEIWKAGPSAPAAGESLRLDTRTHELLGYRPVNGQKVVLFFVDGPSGNPLEVLPVADGVLAYSPHDASVREKLTLPQLKERVAGLVIPLKISFIGLKSAPSIAFAHNSLAPVLVLFDDHLVQRVIFKQPRKYSEIEYVEVSRTDTDNLDIVYADSSFTFSCKLAQDRDLAKVLQFFARKGVRLGEAANKRALAGAGKN